MTLRLDLSAKRPQTGALRSDAIERRTECGTHQERACHHEAAKRLVGDEQFQLCQRLDSAAAAAGLAGILADPRVKGGGKNPQQACADQQHSDEISLAEPRHRHHQHETDADSQQARGACGPAVELSSHLLRNRLAENVLRRHRTETASEAEERDEAENRPARRRSFEPERNETDADDAGRLHDTAGDPDPLAYRQAANEAADEQLRYQRTGLANRYQQAQDESRCADRRRQPGQRGLGAGNRIAELRQKITRKQVNEAARRFAAGAFVDVAAKTRILFVRQLFVKVFCETHE